MSEYKSDKFRESAEKVLDFTRKTLQIAGFRANQCKQIVQKKYELNILHKNISSLYEDIGKVVDEVRSSGEENVFAREDIRANFRRLDSYKIMAIELEEEIERIKARTPPDPAAEGKD